MLKRPSLLRHSGAPMTAQLQVPDALAYDVIYDDDDDDTQTETQTTRLTHAT